MNKLSSYFKFNDRNTNFKQEIIAGLTTFLAMVYSVAVVPNMLSQAGFPASSVFIATCLISGIGSILIGLFANLPMAIGCAISLTAFTAYSLVLGQHIDVKIALGAIFIMGIIFTLISITGIRKWILKNIPIGVAHGTGIGIGLFLFLIACKNVGFIIPNPSGVLLAMGNIKSFPVLISFFGLLAIIGLEKRQVKGSILIVIAVLTLIGFIFDNNLKYQGLFALPSFNGDSLFFKMDLKNALDITILPVIFALVITAIFDATGTIRAVAGQAGLVDQNGNIENAGKALTMDSTSSILAGLFGTSPAAVYIESTAGAVAGGRTGITSITVGILFLFTLFIQPIAGLVPNYATAPALMYVGLLMMSNVTKLDFSDFVDAMSGLICAVFIVFTTNIVTGIMLGFVAFVVGRAISFEFNKLKIGTLLIAIALFLFYILGYSI